MTENELPLVRPTSICQVLGQYPEYDETDLLSVRSYDREQSSMKKNLLEEMSNLIDVLIDGCDYDFQKNQIMIDFYEDFLNLYKTKLNLKD
jgi:hypothetical protein